MANNARTVDISVARGRIGAHEKRRGESRASRFFRKYGQYIGIISAFILLLGVTVWVYQTTTAWWEDIKDTVQELPEIELPEFGATEAPFVEVSGIAVTLPTLDVRDISNFSVPVMNPDTPAFADLPLDVPIYINKVIADKGCTYHGYTYYNINTFLDMLGIKATVTETEDAIIAKGTGFDFKAPKNNIYTITNGRYQYVPCGLLKDSNNNLFLPGGAISKIFNIKVEETKDKETNTTTSQINTSGIKLIQGGGNFYDINLDANVFYWLPHIIAAETAGEGLDSKLAVANVVINRLKHELFPDTIYGVIYDTEYAIQFSPIATTGVKGIPDELSYVAAFLCLEGYNNIDSCMYYVNPKTGSTAWFDRSLVYYNTIGKHRFYFKRGDIIPNEAVDADGQKEYITLP